MGNHVIIVLGLALLAFGALASQLQESDRKSDGNDVLAQALKDSRERRYAQISVHDVKPDQGSGEAVRKTLRNKQPELRKRRYTENNINSGKARTANKNADGYINNYLMMHDTKAVHIEGSEECIQMAKRWANSKDGRMSMLAWCLNERYGVSKDHISKLDLAKMVEI